MPEIRGTIQSDHGKAGSMNITLLDGGLGQELLARSASKPTGLWATQLLIDRPELVRARELFLVGQDSRGRSEWDAVIRHLSNDEKLQAAVLADRWGWHSRAIAAVASSGEYDDLSIRYPLPYQASFEEFSTRANISSTWAYSIARSESLFMRDVRSSAGAIVTSGITEW